MKLLPKASESIAATVLQIDRKRKVSLPIRTIMSRASSNQPFQDKKMEGKKIQAKTNER
jgi:predicted RNA-binding protein with RPS1 domain